MKQVPVPCVFTAGFLSGAPAVCVFRMVRRWWSSNKAEEMVLNYSDCDCDCDSNFVI